MVLENYGGCTKKLESVDNGKEGPQNRWVQEVLKNEGHVSPSVDVTASAPPWQTIVNDKGGVNVTM